MTPETPMLERDPMKKKHPRRRRRKRKGKVAPPSPTVVQGLIDRLRAINSVQRTA